MKSLSIFLFIFWNISKAQCEQSSCRTNCSKNGTSDDQCWHDALVYRSSELIEQLFSFGSLSVYVDAYQRHHPNELNDSISLIGKSLENHLFNESTDAQLNQTLFNETKNLLLQFCRNLTSIPVPSVDQFPSLSCSIYTCSSDILNYMVLFIITIITSSLILIVCIVQAFQTRRISPSVVTTQQGGLLTNSLPTTNIRVNT